MDKPRPDEIRRTVISCFCGGEAEITARVTDLQAGVSFVHKCRNCNVNWNIYLREHNGRFREVRYV